MAQKLVTTTYTKQTTGTWSLLSQYVYCGYSLDQILSSISKAFFSRIKLAFCQVRIGHFSRSSMRWFEVNEAKKLCIGCWSLRWRQKISTVGIVWEGYKIWKKNHNFIWNNITSTWIWRFFKYLEAFLKYMNFNIIGKR